MELMEGKQIVNDNSSGNILKSYFSVCPVCNNIILSMGQSLNVCCGVTVPVQEADDEDEQHKISVESVENELFITINHEMSKKHFISFIAYKTFDKCEILKLYPEQNAEARFFNKGKGILYVFCNKDGLFKKNI